VAGHVVPKFLAYD